MSYKIPTEPSRARAFVWRKLKKLGAAYLQQAAALLLDRPELATELESRTERIREFGGEVSLLRTSSAWPEPKAKLIQRFNQQRDENYAELAEVA